MNRRITVTVGQAAEQLRMLPKGCPDKLLEKARQILSTNGWQSARPLPDPQIFEFVVDKSTEVRTFTPIT